MRFLSPILCLSLASIVSSDCPDDHGGLGADKEHSCAPTPSYCTIKCPKDGVCTFVNVDGNGDEDAEAGATNCAAALAGEVGDFNFAELTAEKCEATCEASAAIEEEGSRCRFWRRDQKPGTTIKYCSLMIEAECTEPDTCGSECYCGDIGCDEAEPAECSAGIQYNAENIHWNCYTSMFLNVPAYKPGSMAPDGSFCHTTHKCADWQEDAPDPLKRHLQVECHEGVWSASEGTGGSTEQYEPVLGDGTVVIKEPTCTGGGTVLQVATDHIQEAGAQLMCTIPPTPADQDPTQTIISAPNHCILLCDFHLGMTIDSVLGEEGLIVFQDGEGDVFPDLDGNENVKDGSRVDCWPDRRLEDN